MSVIRNPYKVNCKLYISMIFLSAALLIITCVFINYSLVKELFLSISSGCFASALVAYLIERSNVRKKNQKANAVYDSVYRDLRSLIQYYIFNWASICSVSFPKKDFSNNNFVWKEWCSCFLQELEKEEDDRKKHLIFFVMESMDKYIVDINKAIRKIQSQQALLEINNVYDDRIDRIIKDFHFEFYLEELSDKNIKSENDVDLKWEIGMIEAMATDLYKYINTWDDIRWYSFYRIGEKERTVNLEEKVRAYSQAYSEEEIKKYFGKL